MSLDDKIQGVSKKLKRDCFELVYRDGIQLLCKACWSDLDLPIPYRTFVFSNAPAEYKNETCDECGERFWRHEKKDKPFLIGDQPDLSSTLARLRKTLRRKSYDRQASGRDIFEEMRR